MQTENHNHQEQSPLLDGNYDELLLIILSYSTVEDLLKKISLCNCRFYKLCMLPIFYRRLTLRSCPNDLTQFLNSSMVQETNELTIDGLFRFKQFELIINRFASQIVKLDLSKLKLLEESPYQMWILIQKCTQLEDLSLYSYIQLDAVHLKMPSVKHYRVNYNPSELTVINQSFKSLPAMRTLDICAKCDDVTLDYISNVYTDLNRLSIYLFNENHATLNIINSMVHLKSLQVIVSNPMHIRSFVCLQGLNLLLEELYLQNESKYSEPDLDALLLQTELLKLQLKSVHIRKELNLTHMKHLKHLTLTDCHLSAKVNLNGLTELTTCTFRNTNLDKLPSGIEHCCSLTDLQLNNNRLHTIPESICSLTRLTNLDLSCNPITYIPDLSCLSRLRNLNLKHTICSTRYPNSLESLILDCEIPVDAPIDQQSMTRLTELKQLSLSNQVRLSILPSEVKLMRNLGVLDLRNCGLLSIPEDCISELTVLRQLILADNKLTSFNLNTAKLKYLEIIDLTDNPVISDLTQQYSQIEPLLPESELRTIVSSYYKQWNKLADLIFSDENDSDHEDTSRFAVRFVFCFHFNYVVYFIGQNNDFCTDGSATFQVVASANRDSLSVNQYSQRELVDFSEERDLHGLSWIPLQN